MIELDLAERQLTSLIVLAPPLNEQLMCLSQILGLKN
jgi:hypothetical protein